MEIVYNLHKVFLQKGIIFVLLMFIFYNS